MDFNFDVSAVLKYDADGFAVYDFRDSNPYKLSYQNTYARKSNQLQTQAIENLLTTQFAEIINTMGALSAKVGHALA